MKNFLIIIILLLPFSSVFSQGNVQIIKDARIDDIIRKKGEPLPNEMNVMMSGYRVQIYFDSDKSLVDKMRSKFCQMHPKVEAYVTYNAPNYFLRVGDFRSQLDANRLKTEVSTEYPTSFVVQERINLPRID